MTYSYVPENFSAYVYVGASHNPTYGYYAVRWSILAPQGLPVVSHYKIVCISGGHKFVYTQDDDPGGILVYDRYYEYSSVTFYAMDSLENPIVRFNPCGGSVTPVSKRVQKGTAIGNMPTPTRDYYMFNGWYTQPSGGSIITSSYIVNYDVTFYAQWKGRTFYYYFYGNGGSPNIQRTIVQEGRPFGTLPNVTYADHKFLGWYINEDRISAGTIFTMAKFGESSAFARWAGDAPIGLYILDVT